MQDSAFEKDPEPTWSGKDGLLENTDWKYIKEIKEKIRCLIDPENSFKEEYPYYYEDVTWLITFVDEIYNMAETEVRNGYPKIAI